MSRRSARLGVSEAPQRNSTRPQWCTPPYDANRPIGSVTGRPTDRRRHRLIESNTCLAPAFRGIAARGFRRLEPDGTHSTSRARARAAAAALRLSMKY